MTCTYWYSMVTLSKFQRPNQGTRFYKFVCFVHESLRGKNPSSASIISIINVMSVIFIKNPAPRVYEPYHYKSLFKVTYSSKKFSVCSYYSVLFLVYKNEKFIIFVENYIELYILTHMLMSHSWRFLYVKTCRAMEYIDVFESIGLYEHTITQLCLKAIKSDLYFFLTLILTVFPDRCLFWFNFKEIFRAKMTFNFISLLRR